MLRGFIGLGILWQSGYVYTGWGITYIVTGWLGIWRLSQLFGSALKPLTSV